MPLEDAKSIVPSAPSGGKPGDKVTVAAPSGKAPTVSTCPQSQQAWNEDSKDVTGVSVNRSMGSVRSSDNIGGVGRNSQSGNIRLSQMGVQPERKPRMVAVRKMIQHSRFYHTKTAVRMRHTLHGKSWGITMTVMLLVALFLPDLWVLTGGNTNLVIDVILLIVMVAFIVELALLSAVDATYFLSFFFLMDIIGTVTMIFDITFMFGRDNSKAEQYSGDGDSKNNLMLLRATRAARVGARAGRLSRVLRVLRFLPFLKSTHARQEQGGIAGAISGQLANLLATRVACLTILLVIVIPLFDVLTFPQSDYSLRTWAERLERLHRDPTRSPAGRESAVVNELEALRSFFSKYNYGPFRACAGKPGTVETGFLCEKMYVGWSPVEVAPPRSASTWEVTTDEFMVAFNMHGPTQIEAVFAIVTIIFIMVLMVFSGLVLSSVVTELAVRPLERMLQTVKDIASSVFKFAANAGADEEEEETYDIDSSSEMKLLEKVVQKLAIIADLQTGTVLEATEDMQEEDIGILNMMQGKNIVEEKIKQDRRSVMPGAQRRKGFSQVVKYEDFGMTAEVYNSWSYNTLNLTKPQRVSLAMYTISRFHDPGDGYVNSDLETLTLQRFIHTVEKDYLPNPFHNFAHAVDVLHTVSRMMRVMGSEHFLLELEQFAILIAAVAHDLAHPGVNNGFLSEVGHELALQYNDRSPLENMHCAKLYSIVSQQECNVFASLSKEQYKEARKYCIETILHTDMMGHNAMVKELQMLYQMNSEIFLASEPGLTSTNTMTTMSIAIIEVFNQPDNKLLSMNNILHSADVSNPCRTWECCKPWAMMVLEEFFSQGDQEKMLGVPVQFLNDRDKLNRPNSQIGFLEFMIVPYFASQIKLWPYMHELGTNLQINIQHWQEAWVQDTNPSEEERNKVSNRVKKVCELLDEAKKVFPSVSEGAQRP